MKILDFLNPDAIISQLRASSKEEVLAELVQPIASMNPHVDKAILLRTLLERESLGSTGIGGGVAIPHGKVEGLATLSASFGRSSQGIEFGSMDNKPTYLFFLLVAPRNSAGDHLKALARISKLLQDPLFKSSIQHADSRDRIFAIFEEYDRRLP
uniref:PTS sugar transporter subunit IIA n=1 Tax=Desulfomonile tiedjei TaxID=2358 RepID=A0A7C4EQL8_9BACT